jgi:hypothetical protein
MIGSSISDIILKDEYTFVLLLALKQICSRNFVLKGNAQM